MALKEVFCAAADTDVLGIFAPISLGGVSCCVLLVGLEEVRLFIESH
jgi:hypothetical protein